MLDRGDPAESDRAAAALGDKICAAAASEVPSPAPDPETEPDGSAGTSSFGGDIGKGTTCANGDELLFPVGTGAGVDGPASPFSAALVAFDLGML